MYLYTRILVDYVGTHFTVYNVTRCYKKICVIAYALLSFQELNFIIYISKHFIVLTFEQQKMEKIVLKYHKLISVKSSTYNK